MLALFAASLTAGCTDALEQVNNGSGGGTPTATATATPTPDQGASDQEKQDILNKYDSAVSKANEGIDLLDASIQNFNNDQFSAASANASDARTRFITAEQRFSTSYDLALQTDIEEAHEITEEGQQYAIYMQEAARQSSRGAEDAMNGNMEAANGHIDEHQKALEDARTLAIRDPDVLKDVLGL